MASLCPSLQRPNARRRSLGRSRRWRHRKLATSADMAATLFRYYDAIAKSDRVLRELAAIWRATPDSEDHYVSVIALL